MSPRSSLVKKMLGVFHQHGDSRPGFSQDPCRITGRMYWPMVRVAQSAAAPGSAVCGAAGQLEDHCPPHAGGKLVQKPALLSGGEGSVGIDKEPAAVMLSGPDVLAHRGLGCSELQPP